MPDSSPPVQEPQSSSGGPRGCGLKRRRSWVAFNDAGWQQLVEAARLCGRPTRVFVRDTSLGSRPPEPLLANAALIRELERTGTALRHLAPSDTGTGTR